MGIFHWPRWTQHAAAVTALISLEPTVTARDALRFDISEAYDGEYDGVHEFGRGSHRYQWSRPTEEEMEKEGD